MRSYAVLTALHRSGGLIGWQRRSNLAPAMCNARSSRSRSITARLSHRARRVISNRKGVVEKAIHYITQAWWRTAQVTSMTEAQASLDRFCAEVGDKRPRGDVTVGELADAEPLMTLPKTAFPAEVTVARTVAPNALVSLWGNRYSVPPGLVGSQVQICWRITTDTITLTSNQTVIAEHRLAPRGAQRTIRLPEHTTALEKVVLAEFSTGRPCHQKLNRPPSDTALALASELTGDQGADPVIDLDVYRRLFETDAS